MSDPKLRIIVPQPDLGSSHGGIKPLSDLDVGVLLGVRTCNDNATILGARRLYELFDSVPGHRTATPKSPSQGLNS
jgi:hypothetical protein